LTELKLLGIPANPKVIIDAEATVAKYLNFMITNSYKKIYLQLASY